MLIVAGTVGFNLNALDGVLPGHLVYHLGFGGKSASHRSASGREPCWRKALGPSSRFDEHRPKPAEFLDVGGRVLPHRPDQCALHHCSHSSCLASAAPSPKRPPLIPLLTCR